MSYDALVTQLEQHRVVLKKSQLTEYDEDGWTVAHAAALRNLLPEDFSDWELTDKNGYSVAHARARCTVLPANFPHWMLADHNGLTVAQVALLNRNLPTDFPVALWIKRLPSGTTLAHLAALHGMLPDTIRRIPQIRDAVNSEGVSVAAIFRQWTQDRINEARNILKQKTK